MMTYINIDSVVVKFHNNRTNNLIDCIVTVKAMIEIFCQDYEVSYTSFISQTTKEEVINKIIVDFETLVNDQAFDKFSDRFIVRDNIRNAIKWKNITADKYDEEWYKNNKKCRRLHHVA